MVCDLEYRITYWNQSAARLYGWSEAEVIGKSIINLLDECPKVCGEATQQVLAQGEWRGEFTKLSNGHETVSEGHWTLVRDQQGQPYAILIVNTDITERKKLEAQILRAQRLESIGTLAGGIAHDFNNILTPILLYTEVTMDLLPAEHEAYGNLREVLVATQRARDLVAQILTFSGEESQPQRQILFLQPIIQEVLQLIRAALPATIEVQQRIDSTGSAVLADPAQMHQVLMNLCTNASHAMHKHGGRLTVTLDTVQIDKAWAATRPHLKIGPYVRLTVSDTGHGMAPDILPRIFDPFFTTKAPGEGTGLGLSVVYNIVMSSGGDIMVDSRPDEGTTFQIYLPVADQELAVEESPERVAQPGTGRILLVDDEEMIVEVTREILTNLGYIVTAYTNSEEALAIFQAQPDHFDLLITDLTMPQIIGTKLIAEVLRLRPNLPTLLISGGSEILMSTSTELSIAGATLCKPFSARDLSQTIRGLLPC
jgi:PAS domain S-box-containing protein